MKNKLKEYRINADLSQRELAKILNISYTTIQNIENEKDFKVSTLFEICEYFNISLNDFFY